MIEQARRLPAQHDRQLDRRLTAITSTSSPATASMTRTSTSSPRARPGIVCFDKNTGKVDLDQQLAGANVLHGQWASVAIAEVNGRPLVDRAAGRCVGLRLRRQDRQDRLEVRHEPQGCRLPADAQRNHRHALHRRQQDVHRQRPGPRARRRVWPHVLRRYHQARATSAPSSKPIPTPQAQGRRRNWSTMPTSNVPAARASPTPIPRSSGTSTSST